ncbi:MAG: carboxypeptidase-like regulatory domain-containing protein [Candidatus Sericytochromatia bacterium]|nr:carboxypeptidase-like regulatory domain-containing protein [Candidatus Sericytochromatia bacterium]
MPLSVRHPRSLVTAALAATVAVSGCAPQALVAPGRSADLPTAVAQGTEHVLPAGTFTGLVAAFDGRAFAPVAGARLEVVGTDTVVETDADGIYRVAGLKPGAYKLAVTKPGFERSESEVLLSPVAGTPRVNVALNPARSGYALKQVAGITVTVSGVVKDPRGAALPNALVRFAAAGAGNGQQTTTAPANAQGFYNAQLTNMVVSAASPGYVQVTATGVSPGGVGLASTAAHTRTVTGPTIVLDPRCDAYTAPGAFTFPSGTFVRLTDPDPEAVVEIERASARADEFYLELTDSGAGGATYAVLANSVADVAGANPPRKAIRFRPPATITGNTFTARYRPFGVGTFNFGSAYVVSYTQADLDADVTYTAQALEDWSKSTVEVLEAGPPQVFGALQRNFNEGLWVPGETARYRLTFSNANPDVSQDLRLTGQAPVGTRIARVLLTTRRNGAVVLNRQALTAVTNFSITDAATGAFEVRGFNIPDREGTNNGEATLEIDFESPPSLPAATDFLLANLAGVMPSANLTLTTAPGAPTPATQGFTDTATSTRGNVVVTAGTGNLEVTKAIVDSATAGLAEVTLTITPGNSTALGAFRLQDVTATDMNVEPARAIITGTQAIPANAPAGFQANDQLVLRVDGVTLTPIVVQDATWTLETFCQFINAVGGNQVNARRSGTNRIEIEHVSIGSASTLEVDNTTSDALSTLLGLTEGVVVQGADGLVAEFANNGAGVTQPGGTTWTFDGTASTHTVVGGAGRVTATFNIVPPAATFTAPDTYTTPITVRYNLRRTNNVGGHALGGGAAGFGATIDAVNAVTPYNDTLRDLAVTGVNAPDPTQITVN